MKIKLVVCAYLPKEEALPVLLVRSEKRIGEFGAYGGPIVRRTEDGYADLLDWGQRQRGGIRWLFGQFPAPL